MKFSYKKLWKLLIDKNMNKRDLRQITGISSTAIAKMGKGDNIYTDILLRICAALKCDISDIIEIEYDQTDTTQ
jgi:DNA-binding Xre family transcriptional regulator